VLPPPFDAVILLEPLNRRGLYPIVDLDSLAERGLSPLSFAERLLAAHPPFLQLRAKSAGGRATLELLRELAPLCRAAGTQLFANDRPDLALLSGADGVHVGQDDVPLADVRRLAPGLCVGVSTHELTELERALAERPDYVAFGPIFTTRSKPDHEPVVGLAGLARAYDLARAANVPLVAIGGIDLERTRLIRMHADFAAVIGSLLPTDGELEGVTARLVELACAFEAP
jgi:thiamine-phosphate pyrophosphorylase